MQSLPNAAFFMEMKEESVFSRDFKGIWIPKEVWLNGDLTMLDKVILMEIDSLDGEDGCTASNEYLCSFCQCSQQKLSQSITKLSNMGFVSTVSFDGRKRVMRSNLHKMVGCLLKNSRQGNKKAYADYRKMVDINIDYNIDDNKKEKDKSFSKSECRTRKKAKGDEGFESAWLAYGRKGSKKKSLEQWGKMDSDEKGRAVSHIPHYVRSRDFVYMKDFERYLRDAVYDSPVYDRNGVLVYDASRSVGGGYAPVSDGFNLHWNEPNKVWVTFSNPLTTQIADGYDSDNRPESARIMYQGWIYKWDAETKKWINE